jgi:N6-adenosine-specific RNA methylase IME4
METSLKLVSENNTLPGVVEALKALDRLESQILNAPSMAVLDAAANAAAGYQRTFKDVKVVADKAGDCWNAAERKLGEELAKVPVNTGTRGQLLGGSNKEPPRKKEPDATPTLKEMGVDKKRAARAKHLAAIPAPKYEAYKEVLKAEGKGITPDAILRAHRAANKAEVKHEVSKAVFSESGPFGTVVIDPPWQMEKIDRDVRPNQDAFDYPTMTYEEIAGFWKAELQGRLLPDCHVFVWTTQKHLPATIKTLDKLGLRYVLTMVWHKPGGFQPIGLPQYNCEFAVYARRGSPIFIDTKDFNCCFSAPRREHSRKPDEFYDVIRRVTGGSRIDVFSREKREGFAQFGNQIDKFGE